MARKLTSLARQEKIRERVAARRTASLSELVALVGVSEMTVRRDLDELERQGALRRTHGGAVAAERLVFEVDFRDQLTARREKKQAIAREAVKLLKPGMRLMLDTGTTTLAVAELIGDMEGLTVITTSLAVVSQLQFAAGIQVILLGGDVRPGSPDLTGGLTEHCLDFFAADIAMQGADAIGQDGSIYNTDLRLARVDRKMRERCERSLVLADSSKIGHTALARNGTLADVDGLITDAEADRDWVRRMRREGARVTLAR
jgi:DeoR/GlpR family transcriptional regulator of sugar metabolism